MNCFGDSGMTDCSLAQPENRAVGDPQLRRVVLNQAGRLSHRWSCPGALTPTGRALGSDHRGRERVLLRPQGLPGTAGRGPACPVVWEAGGEIPPPTRFCGDGPAQRTMVPGNMLWPVVPQPKCGRRDKRDHGKWPPLRAALIVSLERRNASLGEES